MQLTFIGLIQLVIGAFIVFGGSLRHAVTFMVISGLFAGSAAIVLPGLGGSSIPPIQFACLIVYLRILAPRGGFLALLPEAVRANRWLALYTFYGVATAMIAPRLFANQVDVTPLRSGDASSLFATAALGPSTQNITTSVYMLGTCAIAVAAYLVARLRGGVATLVTAAIVVSWLHIVLGLMTALAAGTPLNAVFEVMRNGSYAQLDQSVSGFVRIRGFFPESSSYADFAFAYFTLNAELWYRSIWPRETGATALALAMLLVISTSSTAYLALAAYLGFFALRVIMMPHLAQMGRVKQLVMATLAGGLLMAVACLVVPQLLSSISDMILHMTVDKSGSDSAQQRLFWAMQGLEAFKASYGLGIGPGSFRSSSLVTSMIGSTGLAGCGAFLAYAFSVFQPTRHSTFGVSPDLGLTIGGAFATAALLALIPACLIAPSADLGANVALFAGVALAMRPMTAPRQQAEAPAWPAPPADEPEPPALPSPAMNG
ncbi:O-antigen ligase family protein [Novosphingobium rosa]|uniref:O-antigen ligase family protein n=1 Tax=Novosphingobium rosa TaxID=76978 RepID=UPI0008340640|nr:O-antigen ligase family protein [Novosphingobium rosa]